MSSLSQNEKSDAWAPSPAQALPTSLWPLWEGAGMAQLISRALSKGPTGGV